MTLAVSIGRGAILGAISGGAFGVLTRESFGESLVTGLIGGVALAALAYFAGSYAAIGAVIGLTQSIFMMDSVLPSERFRTTIALAALGATTGYAVGLLF